MRIRFFSRLIPENRPLIKVPELKKGGPASFISLIGIIIGALGGFTAALLGFGYITIVSFISSLKLYGIVEFPVQFYREASISLLNDALKFYYENQFKTLFVVIVLISGYIVNRKLTREAQRAMFRTIYLVAVLTVVLLTFILEYFQWDVGTKHRFHHYVFFYVSIPFFISLFFYLIKHFEEFDFHRPFQGRFGIPFLMFILLLVGIPKGYGSSIFDLDLFEAEPPICEKFEMPGSTKNDEDAARRFKYLYLMGHTANREVFSSQADRPPALILVDRKLIQGIKVKYDKAPFMTLRKLLFESELFSDNTMMKGEATKYESNALE
jgi:hypothetical protein